MQPWLSQLLIASVVVVGVHCILFLVLSFLTRHTRFNWDAVVVSNSRMPSLCCALLYLWLVLLRGWNEVSLETEKKLRQGLRVLLIVSTMWWAFRLADSLFTSGASSIFVSDELSVPFEPKQLNPAYRLPALRDGDAMVHSDIRAAHQRALETKLIVLRRIAIVFISFLGVIGILSTHSDMSGITSYLMVHSSILAFVVGVAAKPLLEDMIASVRIAFTQQIKLYDQVTLTGPNGVVSGRVEEFCTTYLVLRLPTQRHLIVPLSVVVSSVFENQTRTSSEATESIFLWVDFGLELAPVRDKVRELLDAHADFDGRDSSVRVIDTSENAKQLRIQMTSTTPPKAFNLKCDIHEQLVDFLVSEFPWALPRVRHQAVGKAS